MSWMKDIVGAAARHGVTLVVVGGESSSNGAGEDPSLYVGRHDDEPGAVDERTGEPMADQEELTKLRAQVQQLTAEREAHDGEVADLRRQLDQAQVPGGQAPVAVVTPTGDNGSYRDQATDVLGLEDEKLTNKLIRLGYDTVGKVADAYEEGALAAAKLKKDWLISVGMALAGMFARSGAPLVTGAAAPVAAEGEATGNSAGDVPDGHTDRPWLQRLGVARDKQHKLNELETALEQKRAEKAKLVKAIQKAGNDPDEDERVDALEEDVIQLEDDIKLVQAHMVSLRWAMGLNPSPELTLDQALEECNLGPWMENPKPRVLAGSA